MVLRDYMFTVRVQECVAKCLTVWNFVTLDTANQMEFVFGHKTELELLTF